MTPTSFARRELPADTLGESLRLVREEAGLSVDELAAQANVQPKYVAAIESGRYDQTPGPTYVRGFLQSIAQALNLSPDAVLARFAEEPMTQPVYGQSVDEASARTAPIVNPVLSHRRLRILATAFVVVVVIAIFAVQVVRVVAPPHLTVTRPAADLVVSEPQVALAGQTDPEVTVQVNGHTLAVDAAGNFQGSIDLQPGLNTLVITAAKKSSRKATVTRRVLVQLPAVVQ